MTMIAKIMTTGESQSPVINHRSPIIMVYAGDELAGVAAPAESLYFITIQSEQAGAPLRFVTDDGQQLTAHVQTANGRTVNGQLVYASDSHHGSLKGPVILTPNDNRPYKIIENDHVVIVRDGEKYDVTGKKLNK